MSYMYVNSASSIFEGAFQNATVRTILGSGQNTKSTAGGTKATSVIENANSNSDSKLKRILNKFRAGHKLTPAELQYLQEKAPDMYQKVIKIQRQREQLESEMESANTKEEAQQIVTDKISIGIKSCDTGDDFSQDAIRNQFHDALTKFLRSSCGQNKQDKEATKSENSDDKLKTDMTVNEKKEDTDDGETSLNSNRYAFSGDFEEEQKHGKRINLTV